MINYQLLLDQKLKEIQETGQKPSLLLHSCCAPCSSYVLEYLNNYFKITIYYYNPNIDTETEFKKRLNEQIRLINEQSKESKIDIIEGTYEPDEFYKVAVSLEDEVEGGKRCNNCYQLRLNKTAHFAKEKNYDYFSTTLSVSPHKNAESINQIGKILEKKYDVKYLYADFKKNEGYKKSIELSKKYNLYRQDYCGCIYSKRKD